MFIISFGCCWLPEQKWVHFLGVGLWPYRSTWTVNTVMTLQVEFLTLEAELAQSVPQVEVFFVRWTVNTLGAIEVGLLRRADRTSRVLFLRLTDPKHDFVLRQPSKYHILFLYVVQVGVVCALRLSLRTLVNVYVEYFWGVACDTTWCVVVEVFVGFAGDAITSWLNIELPAHSGSILLFLF